MYLGRYERGRNFARLLQLLNCSASKDCKDFSLVSHEGGAYSDSQGADRGSRGANFRKGVDGATTRSAGLKGYGRYCRRSMGALHAKGGLGGRGLNGFIQIFYCGAYYYATNYAGASNKACAYGDCKGYYSRWYPGSAARGVGPPWCLRVLCFHKENKALFLHPREVYQGALRAMVNEYTHVRPRS